MVWLSVAAAIFLADSVIKHWAEKKLSDKAVREVAGDRILLRKLHNYGAACNIGEKTPKLVKAGAFTMWIVYLAAFCRLLRCQGHRLAKTGGACVLGGGASNLADRVTKGYVTDYFSFNVKWKKLRRLVFNISDLFVIFGTLLSLAGALGKKKDTTD